MSTMSTGKKYIFFFACAVVMMSMTLSSYGIGTIQPRLLTQFNAMQYYTLTSLMASIGMLLFLPIAGKLTDAVGRRPLLVFGGVVTLVSSIAAGRATSFLAFIVMRGMITVGTAFLTPLPTATLPFVFERKQLPQLYGIQGAFLALGTFFGSTIAGFLSDHGIAWVAVAYPGVLAALGAAVMFAFCPAIPKKSMPAVDIGGIILLFLVVGPVMYISSFGPRVGWGSGSILGAMVLTIAALIAFINVEKRVKSPVVDVRLFLNPIFTGTMLCTFLMTWYQSSMRVYVPMVIQNVMGLSATISGSVLLPRSILNILFPALCGAWVAKDSHNRCWKGLLITGGLIALGNLIISFVSPGMSLWLFFIGLGITGIAESFKQSSLTPAVQSVLTAENMGSGMGVNAMMGSMGSALSTCVFGVVFDSMAPDTSIVESVPAAASAVFLVAAASGLVVCLLAFWFVRPRSKVQAS